MIDLNGLAQRLHEIGRDCMVVAGVIAALNIGDG